MEVLKVILESKNYHGFHYILDLHVLPQVSLSCIAQYFLSSKAGKKMVEISIVRISNHDGSTRS